MDKKLTKMEVAVYLKTALILFCGDDEFFRPELTEPFRQGDSVFASEGHFLVRVRAKEAGVAISPFKFNKNERIKPESVIPAVGFEHLLCALTLSREEIRKTIDRMKKYEENEKIPTAADVYGVFLSIEGLSHIEVAMRVFGAEQARLVWHDNCKVLLQLCNAKGEVAVEILHMGIIKDDRKVFTLQATENFDSDFGFDWQKGMKDYNDIMADLARQEEEERMARREVYLVPVVKRAYIPVYARNAKEAEELCDKHFFDPEDNGDDEWEVGDVYAPEVEDLDDLEDCYKHVITRDGMVDRYEIYKLEKISIEWEKKQKQSAESV